MIECDECGKFAHSEEIQQCPKCGWEFCEKCFQDHIKRCLHSELAAKK